MSEKYTNPPFFYKFGKTKKKDVLDRFQGDTILNYYKIEVIFSQYLTEHEADEWENEFLQRYPKFKYDFELTIEGKISGISEMRLIDPSIINKVRSELYDRKKKLQVGVKPWERNTKFYLVKFLRKEECYSSLFFHY